MTVPRLSICIATLNRARFLDAALFGIIDQAVDDLEVVVVDGGSTDGTEEVVTAHTTRFPRLRYLRLDAPGGVDEDYCRAVDLAAGEYVWLFADDDVLKQGSVESVLRATESNVDLIVVNAETRDERVQSILTERRMAKFEDDSYSVSETERLFVETANHLSFIGATVIKRSLWNQREKGRYLGSGFVHVGVIFQAPLPNGAMVIAQPLIAIRAANASWAARYFEIWMFSWPEVVWSFSHLPEAVRHRVFAAEPWRRPGALLICRAKAAYSYAEFRRRLAPEPLVGWRRGLSILIALIPGPFANAAIVVYFSIFRPNAKDDMLDFRLSRFYLPNWLRSQFSRKGISA